MATIRLAEAADITRILELYRQLSLTSNQSESHRQLGEYQQVFTQIMEFLGQELVVAEENGTIIGTLVLIIVPNLSHEARPWALVENIVVDKQYRRRGIGRLLMNYAIGKAQEAGCYKIGLSSNKRRKEAHKFYRSLGFKTSAHGFRHYY